MFFVLAPHHLLQNCWRRSRGKRKETRRRGLAWTRAKKRTTNANKNKTNKPTFPLHRNAEYIARLFIYISGSFFLRITHYFLSLHFRLANCIHSILPGLAPFSRLFYGCAKWLTRSPLLPCHIVVVMYTVPVAYHLPFTWAVIPSAMFWLHVGSLSLYLWSWCREQGTNKQRKKKIKSSTTSCP